MMWANFQLDLERSPSSLDSTTLEQEKVAAHYSDMQTIIIKDHLSKGSKYTEYDVMKDTERLLVKFLFERRILVFFKC